MNKIEIVQSDGEQPWHARIVAEHAGDRDIICSTEQYARRSGAIHAISVIAETFGVHGKLSVQGPPGNTLMVFSQSTIGHALPAEYRFPLYDVDERA